MPPADAPPPNKRRKTSSPSPPHRRTSHSSAHRPSQSPDVSRTVRRNPLEGFDDEEELPEEREQRERDEALLARNGDGGDGEAGEEEEHCAICLSPIENKTVVFPCHHGQFCWNCIRAWTDQSRKCPLCLGPIEHLIHNIRSSKDYQVHYLIPLHALASTSAAASDLLPPRGNRPPRDNQALPRHALYGHNRFSSAARLNEKDDTTWRERQEERELERRRYIYREGLYAKHVASNRYTGFKPFSPQTFANNPDLKSKVIKFIRRELQVFPAVDVAFLTTYLVSIASQLDLRSSAAIRLISDFLSEQDAQHLVHEITTFARSPFKSLEGYDRFVQYGRPHREVPKARELEELVLEPEDLQRDAPRFEEHMRRKRAEDNAAERARPRPPPPMAGLPPRPRDEVRRGSQGEGLREGRADNGYGPPPRERRASGRGSPPPPLPLPPSPPRRRESGGGGEGYRRASSSQREPDWRDRDERYTGSYYLSSHSRRDGARGGRYAHPPAWAKDQERRHREERARDRRRSRSRDSRHRSPSPRGRPRSPSRSRSHSPARSRSPADSRRDGSSSRSRTLQADSNSRTPHVADRSSPAARRRSRSLTPIRRTASHTPPAPLTGLDTEHEDAISLTGPSFSSAPTPRPATPAAGARPTLSIFGAARRLLANGRVVTLSEDGRASLQAGGGAEGKGKGRAREPPALVPAGQEPYDAVPGARPASPAGKTLLARLGGVAAPSPTPAMPASSSAAADAGQSLRAKLQARLTAEYREALASRAPGASADAKRTTDLRGLLQARLTAEKALAYEELTRAKVQASLAASRERADGEGHVGTTTFSQATRELLLARLEEERLLAEEEGAAVYDLDVGPGHGFVEPEHEVAPVTAAAPAPSTAKSENALKAALLEKRKAAVEAELHKRSGELKERLMRQKLLAKRKGSAVAAVEMK